MPTNLLHHLISSYADNVNVVACQTRTISVQKCSLLIYPAMFHTLAIFGFICNPLLFFTCRVDKRVIPRSEGFGTIDSKTGNWKGGISHVLTAVSIMTMMMLTAMKVMMIVVVVFISIIIIIIHDQHRQCHCCVIIISVLFVSCWQTQGHCYHHHHNHHHHHYHHHLLHNHHQQRQQPQQHNQQ